MVVLPQFGDELSSLQLYLRVGGQVVGGRALSDHSIGLDVQIPVDTENKGGLFLQELSQQENTQTTTINVNKGGTNPTLPTEKLKMLNEGVWSQYSHSWPVWSGGGAGSGGGG